MFKKMRNIAKTRSAGAVIYWIVRLYCATFRLKVENETNGSIIWNKAEGFFFAGGISSFLPGFAFLKNIENISPP